MKRWREIWLEEIGQCGESEKSKRGKHGGGYRPRFIYKCRHLDAEDGNTHGEGGHSV